MLHVTPKFGDLWEVHDESGLVGKISVGSRFVTGGITIGDESYSGRIAGWLNQSYVMKSGDVVVAETRALSPFGWDFVLECSGAQYTLRGVDLVKENTVVGSVAYPRFLSRAMTADLPGELPIQIRFFIIWLRLWSMKFGG